ncbi:PREDICTED: MLP-like protein 423 [Ipomoea nil]|uniref:MLP-like protein 423 n=1 Tax=Ipomoea nil TaxID=35883 RepID=UPI00090168E8|nr:PREDICTED: MLP-like protein 423 [Ipomoea nil]
MAAQGKIEVDLEVSIGADKFWNSIRDSTTLFPKAFPDVYKSIEVLEGDGKAVGSIRLIKYVDGAPLVTFSKEKIDTVDDEKKTVSYHVIEGDILKYYKDFKAYLSVTPKGDGSLVKWGCEFEKASAEVPDPHLIKDAAVKTFKDLEAFLKA